MLRSECPYPIFFVEAMYAHFRAMWQGRSSGRATAYMPDIRASVYHRSAMNFYGRLLVDAGTITVADLMADRKKKD